MGCFSSGLYGASVSVFGGVYCVTQEWVCFWCIPVGEGLSLFPCQRVMHSGVNSLFGVLKINLCGLFLGGGLRALAAICVVYVTFWWRISPFRLRLLRLAGRRVKFPRRSIWLILLSLLLLMFVPL